MGRDPLEDMARYLYSTTDPSDCMWSLAPEVTKEKYRRLARKKLYG